MTINKQASKKLKAAAAKANCEFDPNMFVMTRDVLALLGELEAADALNKHLELAIRKADGCSEALRRKAESAEKRIAELEAHTVTVKLPAECLNADGSVNADMANTCPVVSAYREAHRAAGITVKGE